MLAAPPHIPHRDFVPWRFSVAGRISASIASSCRRPKTLYERELVKALPHGAGYILLFGPFGAHPSVRTRGLSRPSRTGPVKDGRRADRATLRLISRPLLDWPEHDGRLGRVGSRAHRACPQQIEHPRHTASTRRISNNSRLPWLPVVKARSAGPASMSMGSCDDRITLYPAAPLRLATLLHARTIAREGWGSSTQRQIGKANSAMVFASHTSDPPNAHSKERRNR